MTWFCGRSDYCSLDDAGCRGKYDFPVKQCTPQHARAACLSRVSTCDSRPLVSDDLGRRYHVCFGSVCKPSKPAVVLSPGTPVLLPHKIQTPNETLARKFVTGVRSETHIKE